MKKILIIGNSGSGKSTLAKMVAEHLGCDCVGTSEVIMREAWKDCFRFNAASSNITKEQVTFIKKMKLARRFGDLFRKFLFDVGNRMREQDPAALVKACLYGRSANIVEGVRTKEEFNACRSLFDLVIWVERPSTEPNITDELRIEDADVVCDNVSTLEALKDWVQVVFN